MGAWPSADEPQPEHMGYRARAAYERIMADIRDLVSLENRVMIAKALEDMDTQAYEDLY